MIVISGFAPDRLYLHFEKRKTRVKITLQVTIFWNDCINFTSCKLLISKTT